MSLRVVPLPLQPPAAIRTAELCVDWDLDNNGSSETPGQTVVFSAAALQAPTSHTITVRVTDNGGLSATDQATVNVIYNFNELFPPVDNLPVLNASQCRPGYTREIQPRWEPGARYIRDRLSKVPADSV